MDLEKLYAAVNALKQGECLKEPATWKNSTLLMNPLMGVLTSISIMADLPMTDSQQSTIAFGIMTIAGLYNQYIHLATSAKVGM
jgi:hypothetical protein